MTTHPSSSSLIHSSDLVLSVKNVSKCFEMYEKPVHRLYQTLCMGKKKFYKEFWALKDISFDVHRGECVGIIGRNGAGKSTLLQIITGTLSPSSGTVETHGRIAALLELGSGFNPEFTGRENVYLNGAILGLSRDDIDRRYNDIAAFADIGEFINQPVKTYSSGMMVRLAFAVQVMVDPEILIVDEALAVGDIGFQMRCYQKLQDLINHGTTLLFVTHDLNTVANFCKRVLYLQAGHQLAYSDDVVHTISAFKESMRVVTVNMQGPGSAEAMGPSEYRFGTHEATIDRCEVLENPADGSVDKSVVIAGKKYYLRYTISARRDMSNCVLGMALRNREGIEVWGENTMTAFPMGFPLHKGVNQFVFSLDLNVNVGEYGITSGLADISVTPRIELDQRWPMRALTIVCDRVQPGYIYAPLTLVEKK